MILSTTIATIFTIAGWVNATADVVGNEIDNQVIGESLKTMKTTAHLLKQKADAETDPVKKQIKLKMADKLSKSYDTLSGEKKGDYLGNYKKSGVGVGKTVIGEIAGQAAADYVKNNSVKALGHYGALQASKSIAVPVAIADGALENLITAKKLIFASKYDPNKTWAMMATSSDNIDTEIEMIKAKDLHRQTQDLSSELDAMIKALDDAEKEMNDTDQTPPETDTTDYDDYGYDDYYDYDDDNYDDDEYDDDFSIYDLEDDEWKVDRDFWGDPEDQNTNPVFDALDQDL